LFFSFALVPLAEGFGAFVFEVRIGLGLFGW
jgi:hypothetical protein